MRLRSSKRRISRRNRRHPRSTTTGLSPLQQSFFNILALLAAGLLISAWVFTYVQIRQTPREQRAEEFGEPHLESMSAEEAGGSPESIQVDSEPGLVTSEITRSIFDTSELDLGFLNDALVRITEPLGGYSGELAALFKLPGESISELTEAGVTIAFRNMAGDLVGADPGKAPAKPGIYTVELKRQRTTSTIEDFHLFVLVPFAEKKNGRINNYRLGTWPFEKGGKPRTPKYANPKGFVELTPSAMDIPVSTHFAVGDFKTKGQDSVWPKYMVLSPLLLDKLELVIDGLQQRGVTVRKIRVMSGFRHPSYNSGGGNTSGRASLSRHQYGDASDIFMDNNGDNWTDDVTGDGKLTLRDAELIRDIVDQIERRYPALVGGVGIYPACCGHGPMTHIDVRGSRARWYY